MEKHRLMLCPVYFPTVFIKPEAVERTETTQGARQHPGVLGDQGKDAAWADRQTNRQTARPGEAALLKTTSQHPHFALRPSTSPSLVLPPAGTRVKASWLCSGDRKHLFEWLCLWKQNTISIKKILCLLPEICAKNREQTPLWRNWVTRLELFASKYFTKV